jgi:hypothetical protein
MSISASIHIGDDETEVFIEADYDKGERGCHTMRNGDPGWPEIPPSIEITGIRDKAGMEIELDARDMKRGEEAIWEALEDE